MSFCSLLDVEKQRLVFGTDGEADEGRIIHPPNIHRTENGFCSQGDQGWRKILTQQRKENWAYTIIGFLLKSISASKNVYG